MNELLKITYDNIIHYTLNMSSYSFVNLFIFGVPAKIVLKL